MFLYVTMLELKRILISIACTINLKLHQMDVKSLLQNRYLKGEIHVGFQNLHCPDHVLKLKKSLYRVKQAS